jgi:hypothetical protein
LSPTATVNLADFQLFIPARGVVITTYNATIEGVFIGTQADPFTVREASVSIKSLKWLAVT